MSLQLANILNASILDSRLSYLELGIYTKNTFNSVGLVDKECVDMQAQFSPTYTMTTDEFFKQNTRKYDIIFIDANHDLDYVCRDYNNARGVANKMIVLHDMFPPSEEHCASGYCSDSYKMLVYMDERNIRRFTLNEDCGLTFLFPPFCEIDRKQVANVSYSTLLGRQIKRYTIEEMKLIIRENLCGK